VADKGNISKANWQALDASGLGHVVSLTPGQYPDWAHRPIGDFQLCDVPEVGPMKLLCGQATISGRQRTVIVLDSPTLRDGQMRGLQQQFGPVMLGLNRLQQSLAQATRRRREDAIHRQVARILSGAPQVRQVLRTELIRREGREGFWRLDWWVEKEAMANLRDRVFGRRMLATDRHDWQAGQVVWAYWGQAEAELVFRQLKDPQFLALRPQYHWTDQKIQVHSFCCVLGYLLAALLRREARRQGLELPPPSWGELVPLQNHSLPRLLKTLAGIRAVLRTTSAGRGRPRVRWQLEDADPLAVNLYRHFVLPAYDLGATQRRA
jgi:hypothetical protein